MTKETIIDLLEKKHTKLLTWLENHPTENWENGPNEKWTTGQQVQHLFESIYALNKALSYPKFLLKYKFGVANRPTRSYEEVTKRYHEKLEANQDRAKIFNQKLKTPTLQERKSLLTMLQIQNKKLQYKTRKFKHSDLDKLILPHPLMGKMTLREIIMWTAYHTEHHTNTLLNEY